MKVNNKHYRSIWYEKDSNTVKIIDQRELPYSFKVIDLDSLEDFRIAIKDMAVRGAPLIGATAAFGIAKQMQKDCTDKALDNAWEVLNATRPTAINLRWALNRCKDYLSQVATTDRAKKAMELALEISDEDVEMNRKIGEFGLDIISKISNQKKGDPVNILTHCNAGWLATVDWGTATSPMYQAYDKGIPVKIWVDETRPRNQGALTSWELNSHGIDHEYIVDNTGGFLMQTGQVDMVIVGTDRTTAKGDVCNKIGTYLKALAAKDNEVPFYVALPSPTIDWTVYDGLKEIPIEERNEEEVSYVKGNDKNNEINSVKVTPEGTFGFNPAFDITPSSLITGLITENGVCNPNTQKLEDLFPSK